MNSLIKKVSCVSPPVVIGEIPRHEWGKKINCNELKKLQSLRYMHWQGV